MIISISDTLRRLASFIERDNTPSDASIGDRTMLNETSEEEISEEGYITKSPGEKKIVQHKKVTLIDDIPLKHTAPPEQRRPRKELEHKKKWNDDNKTNLMKDYMTEYRADGKDKEVDGPKSTCKKKISV